MPVSKDTVRDIARLARIEVPEDDLEPLAGELSTILGWVERLEGADTSGVQPVASVTGTALRRREDEVTDGGIADDITANAPETRRGMFAVPKVVP